MAAKSCVLAVSWGAVALLLTHRFRHISLMTSRSRDGDWVANTGRALGFSSIRGGSSAGGVFALQRALEFSPTMEASRWPSTAQRPSRDQIGAAFLASRAKVGLSWCVLKRLPHGLSRVGMLSSFQSPSPGYAYGMIGASRATPRCLVRTMNADPPPLQSADTRLGLIVQMAPRATHCRRRLRPWVCRKGFGRSGR